MEHESRKMHTLSPEKTCLPHRNAKKSISVDIVLCVAGSKIVLVCPQLSFCGTKLFEIGNRISSHSKKTPEFSESKSESKQFSVN